MKNRQDIFIEVVQRLCAQGKQSSDGIHCMRRGPSGLKDPEGWLIPDSAYIDPRSNILGQSKVVQEALLEGGVDTSNRAVNRLLRELRDIHDLGEVEDWPDHFLRLARTLKLNAKVVRNAFGLPDGYKARRVSLA